MMLYKMNDFLYWFIYISIDLSLSCWLAISDYIDRCYIILSQESICYLDSANNVLILVVEVLPSSKFWSWKVCKIGHQIKISHAEGRN